MTSDDRTRIHDCHLKSTELLAQAYVQLQRADELFAARRDDTLSVAIQETRAMRAEAQKLMVKTRQLISVARAAMFLVGRD